MKVLMINKFYYIKGGSETYYFSLKKLLEEKGHQVIDFSMKNEKNFESPYSDYFVDEVDYNKPTSIINKVSMAFKLIYSLEAKNKLEELIKKTKPDIAHLHIFQHQLSLSVLDVLKKYNIPIVYTAHDLKMLCPNYKMLNCNGVCEACKGHRYYNCVRYSCVKDSKVKSLLATVEAYLNQARKGYNKIDVVITPSQFYYSKFLDFGITSQKLKYIPNFLEAMEFTSRKQEDFYLYVGRLSEEKGIGTLIEAFQQLDERLYIVGTGPIEEALRGKLRQGKNSNISLLGYKSGNELKELTESAKAVILPSEWYENSPYSAIESIRAGRPIIGADIGGIPEMVKDGANGYIFKSGDKLSLIECIKKMEMLSSEEYVTFEKASYNLFLEKFTLENHYPQLLAVYQQLVGHS